MSLRSRSRSALLQALLAGLLTLGSTHATAQEALASGECSSDPSNREEARALFISGSGAVEAGRWSDAIEVFERAYALSCAGSALYNLAISLRGLGRHREARDMFDRLLNDHPDLAEELRSTAQQFRDEEAARVAVVELMGISPEQSPEITFDGRPVDDDGSRPIEIETDPGDHALIAQIPNHHPFLWDGTLSDGERQGIHLSFEVIAGDDSGTVIAGIIVGVLAAGAIAAGVGLGLYLQDEAQLLPLFPNRTIVIQ